MLSFRIQWSLAEAFWNTVVWTILMLLCAPICSSIDVFGSLLSAVCALAILPPIVYRWLQFYSMYGIHSVSDADGKVRLEVGHRQAFEERYNASMRGDGMSMPTKHTLLLDNEILVVADSANDLACYERILAESKNYRQHFNLISSCDKYNAKMNYKGEVNFSGFS